MGSKLHACLSQQYWLWLLSLILIKIFVYLFLLEEPQNNLFTRFISVVPFSEKPHDFYSHKREICPESGNFSRSIWVNLIKANERKMCVCERERDNFPFCHDPLTITFKSLVTNAHVILNY